MKRERRGYRGKGGEEGVEGEPGADNGGRGRVGGGGKGGGSSSMQVPRGSVVDQAALKRKYVTDLEGEGQQGKPVGEPEQPAALFQDSSDSDEGEDEEESEDDRMEVEGEDRKSVV